MVATGDKICAIWSLKEIHQIKPKKRSSTRTNGQTFKSPMVKRWTDYLYAKIRLNFKQILRTTVGIYADLQIHQKK